MPLTLEETEKLITLIESMREVPQPLPTSSWFVPETPSKPNAAMRNMPTGWITVPGLYTLTAPRAYLRIESDDVDLDLNGFRIDSIVCGQTKDIHRIRIHGGEAGSIFFDRRSHSDIYIGGVRFSGSETAIFPSGERIEIVGCTVNVTGAGYALFIGDVAVNSDLIISQCRFSSDGPNSLVRICNTDRVVIYECVFTESVYHHLRFHGYSRLCADIWVEGCEFNGTGNGVGVGFDSGAGERHGCKDVTFYRCKLNVGGPDKANFDRNRGGAHAQNVRVIACEGTWE